MKSTQCFLFYMQVFLLFITINNVNTQLTSSGRVSSPSKHPHAVLVNDGCGGTLVHPSWILTAGHCTTSFMYAEDIVNEVKTADGVERNATTSFTHPSFEVGPYWNDNGSVDEVWAKYDFALLKLDTPVEPSEKVKPIAINTKAIESSLKGMIATYPRAYPEVRSNHTFEFAEIYEGEFKTWNDVECKQALDGFNNTMMFCGTGYSPLNSYACHGDSGSGFVANNKLYGVSSWVEDDNIDCHKKGVVVFAKVASIIPWIEEHVPK